MNTLSKLERLNLINQYKILINQYEILMINNKTEQDYSNYIHKYKKYIYILENGINNPEVIFESISDDFLDKNCYSEALNILDMYSVIELVLEKVITEEEKERLLKKYGCILYFQGFDSHEEKHYKYLDYFSKYMDRFEKFIERHNRENHGNPLIEEYLEIYDIFKKIYENKNRNYNNFNIEDLEMIFKNTRKIVR